MLRTQVDVVTPTAAAIDDVDKTVKLPIGTAVLNAQNGMLIEISTLCHGEVIFFSINPELPVIVQHRMHGTGPSLGKRAVIIRDNVIILASGANEVPLMRTEAIAGTYNAQALENILAAVGAAWALEIEPDVIRVGINAFGFSQEKWGTENQSVVIDLPTQGDGL